VDTLVKMREILAPKLAAARAGLAGTAGPSPKQARAQRLTNDGEYNMQFVGARQGGPLRLLRGGPAQAVQRLDEALPLLGKPALKSDDALVRGGYCAVLCHSTAG